MNNSVKEEVINEVRMKFTYQKRSQQDKLLHLI